MQKILFFLLITVFAACKGKVEPEESVPEPEDSLLIAYNVLLEDSTDNYEIFVMGTDGKNPKNISNNPGVDWVYYSWKDKLYFISDRDTSYRNYFLYEMDTNGENIRKISSFRLEDSWMSSRKNGKELVISGRKDDNRHTLYFINTNGKILRQLTHDTVAYFNDPCFSPDGKEIVYRYKKERLDRSQIDELWIMDEYGRNVRQLTHYPENDSAEWHAYHAGPPSWEPVQNIISFTSKRNGNYSIFTIKPDGSDLLQLTDEKMNETYHSWSPNGKWITFDGSDLENKKYSIYIMHADGSGIQRLTNKYRFEQGPVFVFATK